MQYLTRIPPSAGLLLGGRGLWLPAAESRWRAWGEWADLPPCNVHLRLLRSLQIIVITTIFLFPALLQSWVTATAGLAADQVIALLRDAAGRRAQAQQQGAAGSIFGDWEAEICDVHAEYFEEYNRWMRKLCLPVSAPSVHCSCALSACIAWIPD
jgi:hypothetical protein